MSVSRVAPLDGLRALAIVLVVLYHLHVPGLTGGFLGVNIFFVLSGYLITSILLRERESTGRIALGRFWIRRLLRLYPALVVMVIAAALLWPIADAFENANTSVWGSIALALTYTSNIGRWLFHHSIGALAQTWSLGMEEQFYLVWPPILVLLLSRRVRRYVIVPALVVVVIGTSVAAWFLYKQRGGSATPDVYFSPVLNLGPLLIGVILAFLFTDERMRRIFAGRTGELATWLGLAALVTINLSIGRGWQESRPVFGLLLPLSGLAAGVMLAGLIARRSLFARLLSLRPIAWFGRTISYSLYLWHVLVLAIVVPLIPGWTGKVVAFVVAALVATASAYLVERPFLRLKDRLEPAGPRRPVGTTPEPEPTAS